MILKLLGPSDVFIHFNFHIKPQYFIELIDNINKGNFKFFCQKKFLKWTIKKDGRQNICSIPKKGLEI